MTRLLAGLLMLSASAAVAQPAATAPAIVTTVPAEDFTPLLWVVRDEDTTIYLFGSLSMLDRRTWFGGAVEAAFDSSRELVLQLLPPEDPAETSRLATERAMDRQNRTLSAQLTAAEYESLYRHLAPLGVPTGAFDRFEPWFATMVLTGIASQQLDLIAANAPDNILLRLARERGMPVGTLESAAAQLQMMDDMPYESQLRRLKAMVTAPEVPARELLALIDAWTRGDEQALATGSMEEMSAGDLVSYELFFTRRNAILAEWVEERLDRPGTVFVAVPAGHLVGRDSLHEQLARRNITSRRVPAQ